jgi:hypothetical protein
MVSISHIIDDLMERLGVGARTFLDDYSRRRG